MSIKTSYFGMLNRKSFKGQELNTVCIARGHRYYYGRCYPALYPTWEMINMDGTQAEYEKAYRKGVLDKLDPLQVYEDLGEDAIMLCHEKYSDIEEGKTFCHRHIVARWLEEQLWLQYDMDVKIEELKDVKEYY